MQANIATPKAFSVRDDHEFAAFKHLMVRLNPQLRVTEVGQGLHVNGQNTVYWGLVHVEGQKIAKAEFEAALREAGFDFAQGIPQLDYAQVVG
jgi:hypothetical protein